MLTDSTERGGLYVMNEHGIEVRGRRSPWCLPFENREG